MKQEHRNYAVGYGRPPERSRFKKGRSGNPAGRRRERLGDRGGKVLLQEAHRKLTLREGDKIERIPAMRAAIRSLFVSAARGKTSAIKIALQAMNEIAAAGTGNEITEIRRVIVDPKDPKDLSNLTEPEIEELQRLLSKARKPPREIGGQNCARISAATRPDET